MALVTVIAGLLIAFPYYAKIFYPKPKEIKVIVVENNNIQQAVFKINGMTCESCAEHVNNEISKVNGVIEFQTSYKEASSAVKYDKNKTSVDSISTAINSTGYNVISQIITTN